MNVYAGKQTPIGMPEAQGLYDPANEHDACGVGFLVNIKGKKSHDLVLRGVDILCNLTHRGAVGADPLDGDGAGLMIQTPDAYYRAVVDMDLPATGDYATGLVFLPKDDAARADCENALNSAVEELGMRVIGWRDVPTDNNNIGRDAKAVEPITRQIFVARQDTERRIFDLKLFVARKRAENNVREGGLNKGEYFYVNSLHSKTVLYKGMLLSDQLPTYFPELSDERVVSSIAFVHQRYSTNTFPTWDLAQPFRFVAHNGEINTLRGNINRMRAREAILAHEDLGDLIDDLKPVIIEGASDTACFDNAFEFLTLTGRPLHHVMAMMAPEAFATKTHIPKEHSNFFRYHATMMEPWDGPANLVACNGSQIVAALDRNGLRPARWWRTDDDELVYASEAGVLNIDPAKIVRKGRVGPGRQLLIDLDKGEVYEDPEIKNMLASDVDYTKWVNDNLITLEALDSPAAEHSNSKSELRQQQMTHGYTIEEMRMLMAPMCINGQEAVGSMGNDAAPAVLSNHSRTMYWYFKHQFAQVTNPPIDPLREELVMSLTQFVGRAKNILQPKPSSCRLLELEHPILSNDELQQLKHAGLDDFKAATVSTLYDYSGKEAAFAERVEAICTEAEAAVTAGHSIVVLSDRGISAEQAPLPILLATSAVHQHLVRNGIRNQCSLILETGDPREVHHFACLLGFGATAINPYLAYETIQDMASDNMLPILDGNENTEEEGDAVNTYQKNFVKAIKKGLLKIFSKMGISTLQSYCGAQILEIIGLDEDLVNKYFTGSNSRIGGAGINEIAQESLIRHGKAFGDQPDKNRDLDRGGEIHWRRDGEKHLMNPETIAVLQHACFAGNYDTFKKYTAKINDQTKELCTLRGLFKFKGQKSIPIEEVEPVEEITKRFCTGAMSLGSISPEAHETLAIAMNQIGGKSNTGEGGEDPARFVDNRRSKIKQVASGRFGVTPHYLVNADELQIKIAQGAKPGEGGQLPGHKVTEYIGWLRGSVPGVTLISPPPHHDIYSIEDLAQLIYDLKNCNPEADVAVKLVSLSGVGTVAAGVSKGHAETVIIAGADGGTGASPMSSIKHAGVPWEIGLAETQQTLVLNDLRGRIRVQTDGQLRTGRDVLIATMLGAEEYGFATVALMTMGCIMMRKCHLDTCPVGIATQKEILRGKFHGKPEYVVNFMTFLAQETRELMAELGIRKLEDVIGRTDFLEVDDAVRHWKSKGLDYSKLLVRPDVPESYAIRNITGQDHGLEEILDRELIKQAQPALNDKKPVTIDLPIHNYNRTTCTMLSGEVAKRYGAEGLDDGTITINFKGIAGQSFGTFLAKGIHLNLEGEGNDYVGKGMSGGRIAIRPDSSAPFQWEKNAIVGNTLLYGATGGEAYFAGRAGERFCVRNSGVTAVIDGVGDHGCEYMTGGLAIILGRTGRNFAAGMSGGFAFVYDEDLNFTRRCNQSMVALEKLDDEQDIATLRHYVEKHAEVTGSTRAKEILENWDASLERFVKVFPHEYRRALNERNQALTASIA